MSKVEKIRLLMLVPITSSLGWYAVAYLVSDQIVVNILNVVLGFIGLLAIPLWFLSFYWGWQLKSYAKMTGHFYAVVILFIIGGTFPRFFPQIPLLGLFCYSTMAVIGLDAKVRLVLLVARLKSQMEFKGESLNPDHIARQKADKLGLDPKKDFHAFYKIRSGIEEKIARILEE